MPYLKRQTIVEKKQCPIQGLKVNVLLLMNVQHCYWMKLAAYEATFKKSNFVITYYIKM